MIGLTTAEFAPGSAEIHTMALAQPTPSTTAPLEVLAGTVERVTYHNAENGFAVLKVQTRGKRDLITVVGHAAAIMRGEWITASGFWVNDRTHGVQGTDPQRDTAYGGSRDRKVSGIGPDARHRA